MGDCAQIVAMLSDYLDRDLPPETCGAIARHLQTCEACGNAAESLRATVGLCRQYRMESKPGPLASDKHDEMKRAFQKALSDMKKPVS